MNGINIKVIIASSIIFILCLSIESAFCKVTLPKMFSDNMVLQRGLPIKIWGEAEQNEVVNITLGKQQKTVKADSKGRWIATLAPRKKGGPYLLSINELTYSNILIGDIWFASGQSNMEIIVRNTKGVVKKSDNQLRFFSVEKEFSPKPASDLKAGEWKVATTNTIKDFSAVAYSFGQYLREHIDVPIGVVSAAAGGKNILAFMPQEEYRKLIAPKDYNTFLEKLKSPSLTDNLVTVNFNAMIYPWKNFPIRGFLWYQGEADVGRSSQQYLKLMRMLIQSYRQLWRQKELPFYYVQVAPYRYDQPWDALPQVWEAQITAQNIPHVGMAATIDIGDVKNIHPFNKREVGYRLALLALGKTYGEKIIFSGPQLRDIFVQNNTVVLKYETLGSKLTSKDGKPLRCFEISGKDGKFFHAEATIDANRVLLSSKKVAKPYAVRFSWYNDAMPNLVNKKGLPALPFQFRLK